ncbi:primosomal protein N', partial [Candidatus Fermentibacteria bacterium]|nr:primosomal protein N' [Candidatus Fermentibacteria bacterium]
AIPAWKPYSYRLDSDPPEYPQGCRVVVPVRRGWKVGLCCGVRHGDSQEDLAAAREFLDAAPALPTDLWDLGMWMSSYYMCPPGIALHSMLPGGFRPSLAGTLEPLPRLATHPIADIPGYVRPVVALLMKGAVPRRTLERVLGSSAEVHRCAGWLLDHNLVAWGVEVSREPSGRTTMFAELVADRPETKVSQSGARILEALQAAGGRSVVSQLLTEARASRAALTTLKRSGHVRLDRIVDASPSLRDGATSPLSLTPAQERAVGVLATAVLSRSFQAFLLHGVTGSGKTEVYLAASSVALERGLSAVCLVPEIALTAQMVARFKGRFGGRVVLVHSRLSPGERHDAWARATAPGTLVIGPRSAIFAPVTNLGLVIVDEEHDPSYKQGRDPRYHGRDVAIMRAHRAGCTVVLGSATPSLETYHHCLSGKYTRLDLPERVERWAMPAVSIVDMRVEPRTEGPLIFSALLRSKLHETVGRGDQALILLNRRGYARSVQCADCGFIPACPDCDVSLTFHRQSRRHLCHYCDYAEPAFETCPGCGGHRLGYGSVGTERVEDELRAILPDVGILRMDRDTTRSRGAHVRIIDAMEREDVHVLVGTQMIAKGLDLPRVTLVGVVNADTPLQFPDFRAGERAFQLLAQVAGRAGRSAAGGEVVVQSYLVDYPAILCAARHDFEAFAREELLQRREAGYPPFSHMVRIEVRCRTLPPLESHAEAIAHGLRATRRGSGGRFLGPAPPLLPRVGGMHRRHLLVFHQSRQSLHSWVRDGLAVAGEHPGTRMIVDVDPLETV